MFLSFLNKNPHSQTLQSKSSSCRLPSSAFARTWTNRHIGEWHRPSYGCFSKWWTPMFGGNWTPLRNTDVTKALGPPNRVNAIIYPPPPPVPGVRTVRQARRKRAEPLARPSPQAKSSERDLQQLKYTGTPRLRSRSKAPSPRTLQSILERKAWRVDALLRPCRPNVFCGPPVPQIV